LVLKKLLSFESLGRTSLQRITVEVKCGGARASEVEEVEAVLVHATAVHPNSQTAPSSNYLARRIYYSVPYRWSSGKRICEGITVFWRPTKRDGGSNVLSPYQEV
jgi:hypothetical protein